MENELKKIEEIIKHLAYAYSMLSYQDQVINKSSNNLKLLLEGIKNEFYEVKINDDKCGQIIKAINMANLAEGRKRLDEAIGMLIDYKKEKLSEKECEEEIIEDDIEEELIL